jgi:ADP-heptose:LPS heptosyltransferase
VVYPILLGYDDLVVLPITKPLAALKILSAYSLDVLIDTSQWTKLSAIYGLFVKAKFKIGFKTSGQYRHIGYDKLINHSNSVHELKNFENLLKPLGINQRGDIAFDFPEINNQSLHNIGIEELKPYVVFHPWASGTRSELREWPIESWAELAKIVLADNFYIIITGSLQNQAEAIELAKMIGEEKKVKVVAGKISFAEAARVIKSAHAVVSVNTGIAHLADQLQVPAIALNGPTNSSRWGLVNSSSINLDVPKKNGGGFLNLVFEYPKNSHYLMNQISVQAVNSALKQLSVKTRAI